MDTRIKQKRIVGPIAGLAVFLLAGLLLSGCGGGGGSPSAPDPTAVSASATASSGLTATLTQEKASVSADTPVVYTMTLTNTTAAPVTIKVHEYAGEPARVAVLQVFDANGGIARPGSPFDAAVPSVDATLAPGQSLTQSQVELPYNETAPQWTHFRGRYRALATFSVNGMDTPVGPLSVTIH